MAPDNETKLDASVERLGMFKPIVVRELADGSLEILGGEHRRDTAIRLGIEEVPYFSVGHVDDHRAKEISLVDNGRYGADDSLMLANLLEELGNPEELAQFLPYSDAEMAAIFSSTSIDVEDLGLQEDDDLSSPEQVKKPVKTHQILRFKVPIEDAERISEHVERTMKAQNFTGADSLTNAGDALVHLLLSDK